MTVPEGITTALRDRRAVVAAGLDYELLRTLVDVLCDRAAADDAAGAVSGDSAATPAEPWRVAVDPDSADRVAYEFALATRIAGLERDGLLEVRVSDSPESTVFAGADGAFAVAGPGDAPTVLEGVGDATSVRAATREAFDAAAPLDVDEPDRETLSAEARRALSADFAAELEDALAAADHLHRRADVNALTLFLAVGARTDHLFADVREWAEAVGVAPRELFVDPRDELVDKGLVETIKIPMGSGHPHSRLRVVDDALADCPPTETLAVLRERFATDDRRSGTAAGSTDRTPVWKR